MFKFITRWVYRNPLQKERWVTWLEVELPEGFKIIDDLGYKIAEAAQKKGMESAYHLDEPLYRTIGNAIKDTDRYFMRRAKIDGKEYQILITTSVPCFGKTTLRIDVLNVEYRLEEQQ